MGLRTYPICHAEARRPSSLLEIIRRAEADIRVDRRPRIIPTPLPRPAF